MFSYFITYLLSPNQPLDLSESDQNTNVSFQASASLSAYWLQLEWYIHSISPWPQVSKTHCIKKVVEKKQGNFHKLACCSWIALWLWSLPHLKNENFFFFFLPALCRTCTTSSLQAIAKYCQHYLHTQMGQDWRARRIQIMARRISTL